MFMLYLIATRRTYGASLAMVHAYDMDRGSYYQWLPFLFIPPPSGGGIPGAPPRDNGKSTYGYDGMADIPSLGLGGVNNREGSSPSSRIDVGWWWVLLFPGPFVGSGGGDRRGVRP